MRRVTVVLVGATMLLTGAQVAFAGVSSNITIHYNADTEMFHGKVTASDAECRAARVVKLFKETANGRSLEGRTTSNANGGWRIELMHAEGHYFAVAPKHEGMHATCDRAVSETVDVM